ALRVEVRVEPAAALGPVDELRRRRRLERRREGGEEERRASAVGQPELRAPRAERAGAGLIAVGEQPVGGVEAEAVAAEGCFDGGPAEPERAEVEPEPPEDGGLGDGFELVERALGARLAADVGP